MEAVPGRDVLGGARGFGLSVLCLESLSLGDAEVPLSDIVQRSVGRVADPKDGRG